MGAINNPTDDGVDDADCDWTTFVTLDNPASDEHGMPLNAFTADNTFSEFEDACARAVAIRDDPHTELDGVDLADDDDVMVTVTKAPSPPR